MSEEFLPAEDISAIAQEAYVYAFPMLMGYRMAYATYLQPASPAYAGPANQGPYGEAVTLDHTFKDVITPNADTPYSFGLLDLRGEPVVLTVPEVTDRYYVMQFEDLFGYNQLFVGSRATGSAPGSYLLVGPQWDGVVPDGFVSSFRSETDLVFLTGRSQLLGSDDQPALAKVMGQYLIGSTTEGLVEDDDGGLTITMQRDEPTDSTELANWLPTPDGRFYLALRMYWPKPAALDGTWNAPPVARIS